MSPLDATHLEDRAADARSTFERALIDAITSGSAPDDGVELAPRVKSAIEAIAAAHPEATVGSIADAYDAFQAEHGDAVRSRRDSGLKVAESAKS